MDTVRQEIDWSIIANSIDYYRGLGYRYIEVPWIVPQSVMMLTCPSESMIRKIEGGVWPSVSSLDGLVGSAEQSFIKMDMDGMIANAKYVACTPCFRIDYYDHLHFPDFMKVELYRKDSVTQAAVEETIGHAIGFFEKYIGAVERVDTADGIDITVNGIEVGSYGIRRVGNLSWVYGTGVALPRFTQAKWTKYQSE